MCAGSFKHAEQSQPDGAEVFRLAARCRDERDCGCHGAAGAQRQDPQGPQLEVSQGGERSHQSGTCLLVWVELREPFNSAQVWWYRFKRRQGGWQLTPSTFVLHPYTSPLTNLHICAPETTGKQVPCGLCLLATSHQHTFNLLLYQIFLLIGNFISCNNVCYLSFSIWK